MNCTCHILGIFLFCLLAEVTALAQHVNSGKWVRLTGGYTTYLFNHRTTIDTPYAEKNISQHHISGNVGVTIADILPLNIVYWSRQSNSGVFRDITDVQVSFNRNAFRNQVQSQIRKRLLALAPTLQDSLLEK